jgi:hypothetical protein
VHSIFQWKHSQKISFKSLANRVEEAYDDPDGVIEKSWSVELHNHMFPLISSVLPHKVRHFGWCDSDSIRFIGHAFDTSVCRIGEPKRKKYVLFIAVAADVFGGLSYF